MSHGFGLLLSSSLSHGGGQTSGGGLKHDLPVRRKGGISQVETLDSYVDNGAF